MATLTFRCAFLICSLGCLVPLVAQKQYWGVAAGTSLSNNTDPFKWGVIYRVDDQALNMVPVLPLDTTNLGLINNANGLVQGSNGRIYFTTTAVSSPDVGFLYSYDPVTDTLRRHVDFGTAQYPYYGQPFLSRLIAGPPGFLYGNTGGYGDLGSVFKYDLTNDSVILMLTIPNGMYNGNPFPRHLTGRLTYGADGFLYGVEHVWPASLGRVFKINTTTNAYTTTSIISTDGGWGENGNMVQYGGKMIGTAFNGGAFQDAPFLGVGTIFEYDLTTQVYQLRHDLGLSLHNPGTGLVAGSNGLWYGQAQGDTLPGGGSTPYTFKLFAYEPVNNTVQEVVNCGLAPLGIEVTGTPLNTSLLSASNGKIYGAFTRGLFEYDPIADTLRLRASLESNGVHGGTAALIEICRKPNYKPRSTTSFNVCAGAHFFYDQHNVNASSVVWRRNGTVVPGLTNQFLEFAAIAEGDEGVWTCTLTNECGITQPPAITITVNAGDFSTSTITGDTLLCGTGDVVVLSGNNGGTWSSGDSSSTLTVTQPGNYFVWNTQACGISMSNALDIAHLDSLFSQPVYGGFQDSLALCVGQSVEFTGNDPGPWSTQTTGVWQDGSSSESYIAQDTGFYYIVVSNACNTDTSNVLHLYQPETVAFPPVYFTDAFGGDADNLLCVGDSVQLHAPLGSNYTIYSQDGQYVCNLNDFITYTTNVPGTYTVLGYDACLAFYDTLYFTINVDSFPPPEANILPDQTFLIGCDQDTVFLSSTAASAYWYWNDTFGFTHYDSSATVQVDWGVSPYYLLPYNGCGEGVVDAITISGTPAPDVQYTEALDTACLSDGPQTLSAATPPGGTYSGAGVGGNTFDPMAAGIGTHTITYTYSDGTCTGYAQDVVVVDICAGIQAPSLTVQCSIAPNPNDGSFTLFIGGAFVQGILSLQDAQGRGIVRPRKVVPGNNAMYFDDLAPGVYFLRIAMDGTTRTERMVIAHDR